MKGFKLIKALLSRQWDKVFIFKYTRIYGSVALPGKMLLVRIIENDKLKIILVQVSFALQRSETD